ncbi:MAG TPA: ABC transporter permease [Xanthobacteraceae bacterium]|nr:ABC transporter permease [Xanthobacteraceae bacterium]
MTLGAPGQSLQKSGPTERSGAALQYLGVNLLGLLWRKRQVMYATTMVELKKRYSGAVLGQIWIFLNPLLFLSTYLFVYLVVLKINTPEMTSLQYLLYIFCGLVPFLAFVDVFAGSCTVIRQNTGMIRNVILPIEFLPLRVVFTALVTQMAGIVLILVLALVSGSVSWHLLWLPLVILLQLLMFAGVALFMASLGVAIPDLGPMSGVIATLLIQVSPIVYSLSMVPREVRFVVYLNPLASMMEVFRACILHGHWPSLDVLAIFVVTSLGTFMLGNAAFARFKETIDDHV